MKIGVFGVPGQGKQMLLGHLRHFLPRSMSLVNPQEADLAVSWGGVSQLTGPYTLNGGLRLDGRQQLTALHAADVPAPEFTSQWEVAKGWVQAGEMVFGRNLDHTQGRDIVSVLSPHFPQRDYWVKMLRAFAEEWRIHVFNGKSIARAKRVYAGQGEPPIVRSRRRGWRMVHDENPPKGLRPLAKRAVEAMRYDFGAVDLFMADDEQYVLEVNKQPGLDNYTAEQYAKAIIRYARGL